MDKYYEDGKQKNILYLTASHRVCCQRTLVEESPIRTFCQELGHVAAARSCAVDAGPSATSTVDVCSFRRRLVDCTDGARLQHGTAVNFGRKTESGSATSVVKAAPRVWSETIRNAQTLGRAVFLSQAEDSGLIPLVSPPAQGRNRIQPIERIPHPQPVHLCRQLHGAP